MAWVFLLIAGVFEIGWAMGLKYSQGFTRVGPSMATILMMVLSFIFLSQSLRTIPLGTAYAVWTGIGAVGTVIVGIFLFQESREAFRLFFLSLIVIGILGLKLITK